MASRKATVLKVIEETPDTKTLRLSIDPPFTFTAGQFITFLVTVDGVLYRRPYSIASIPEEKSFVDVGIKVYPQGKISPILFNLKERDTVDIIGPYGRFTFEENELKPVLIGAGSGIVPLMGMLRHALAAGSKFNVTLLYSNKTIADIIYHNELISLARTRNNFRYVPTVTRWEGSLWDGKKGRINKEMISEHVNDIGGSFYYLCGSPDFVSSMVAILHELGVPKERIKREEYD